MKKKNDRTVTSTATARRATAYSDEQFREAWYDFIRRNPTEVILISTMKAIMPVRSRDDCFEMHLDNPAQMENMEAHLAKVLGWLRDKLDNDNVTITMSVREKVEGEKVWTDREILDFVIERNPAFAEMMRQYKLKLE